jgi:amino acid permease
MKKTKKRHSILIGILLTIIVLLIAGFLVSKNFDNLDTSLIKKYPGSGECVGFVERYYQNVFNIEIKNVGNAQNLFGIASRFGLHAHKNGSSVHPQPGDILVFKHKNRIGHVSIITDVNKNGLKIVEQNWGKNVVGTNGNQPLPANFSNNKYTIEDRNDYQVMGWVSRTSRNPSNGSSFLISNSSKNWLPDEGTKIIEDSKKTNSWNVKTTSYNPTVMSPLYLNGANQTAPNEVMIRAKIINNTSTSFYPGKIFLRNENGEWETEIPFQFENSQDYTKAQKIDLSGLRPDFKITQARIQLNKRPRVGREIWSFEWIYIK